MAAVENNIIFDNIKINKNRVFNIIGCYDNSPVYLQILKEFELLLKKFTILLKPSAQYLIEKKQFLECSHIIYAGITLGIDLTNYISKLFDVGNYSQAIILNAICDDFLMQADKAFRCYITNECKIKGINAVNIYIPHESIDAKWAKEIVEKLDSMNLKINDSFSVEPAKTLLYLLSADETKKGNINHSCDKCKSECKWKDTLNT